MRMILKKTGKALPALKVRNIDMGRIVETDDDWIRSRTGIAERRISASESALYLACSAARQALEGTDPAEVGLVIVATATPDMVVPSMSSLVKKEMGLSKAIAFDVNAACSGFVYALWMARSLTRDMDEAGFPGGAQKVLIIGVERLSRILDWEDRSTCVLFGDGAGAGLFHVTGAEEELPAGVIGAVVRNYDDREEVLTCGMGYGLPPKELLEWDNTPYSGHEFSEEKPRLLHMQGKQVFKFAVKAMGEVMDQVLGKCGMEVSDIDFFVPHQANVRILEAAAKRYNIPMEKFQISLESTGNTSAASVPMALHDALEAGKIKKGHRVMLLAFGGGLSAGAAIIEF